MKDKLFWEVLSLDSYWIVNKKLLKKIGLDATLFLSDIISKNRYFYEKDMLDNEGFFFNTQDNFEESLNLSPYKQRQVIWLLEDLGVITTKLKGSPPVKFFKINYEALEELISN